MISFFAARRHSAENGELQYAEQHSPSFGHARKVAAGRRQLQAGSDRPLAKPIPGRLKLKPLDAQVALKVQEVRTDP
jgi:hypothetical protein